eukprot:TRINITY_DN7260_c0_g1_i1.p1 TRINITY_DN7260_c0_g1~~TRINITY_DN7260_c0_g1_i1.p1  ORF type:complete len:276 (-),score=44.54 TRINITY_DN7260_c0_g1_i1:543-1370(-)
MLSVFFLANETSNPLAAVSVYTQTPLKTWLLFLVPSILYAVNNNLDIINNQYMDPATESVLTQMKILTTALAWKLVFKKTIGQRKWWSLILLFVGCTVAGYPSGDKRNSMYIEPFGFVLIALYVVISATAGVYNEWLYKGIDKDESIHVSNIKIYTIGCLFLLLAHELSAPATGNSRSLREIFHGYNIYTWLLVTTYTVMGLLLAQVMKYFDSIVKLFISGASMYVSALLTALIFGRYPNAFFIIALSLVSMAMALYNLERISPCFQAEAHKKAL